MDEIQASPFWRQVIKIKLTVLCFIKFQIGNGAIVKFKEDYWLEQPLCITYPELYERTGQRNRSIK
jgi:hypothetical protein